MTRYISEPVRVDQIAVRREIDDAWAALQPGVEMPPASLLDYLLDVSATITREDRELFTEQLAAIFRYSGEKIDRVGVRSGIAATLSATWTRTAVDAAAGPRTVPAGAEITVTGADGEPVAFASTAPFTFPAGVDTISGVTMAAVVAGADGNDLALDPAPALTLPWVQAVTVDVPSSGGADEEPVEAYLDRLADTKPLRLDAIANAADLARWLRNRPGVGRALAVDNFNGATGIANAAGHVSAWVADAAGAALAPEVRAALALAAQTVTLTNLFIHVMAPVYTLVEIEFAGVSLPGYDPLDVESRGAADLLALINPATFAVPDLDNARGWRDVRVLYYQDVVTALNMVRGFDRYTSLTLNGGTDDLVLAGPGGLPDPGSTVTGTVVAP